MFDLNMDSDNLNSDIIDSDKGVSLGVVIDKLHSFETADEIADYFRSCGIVAEPMEGHKCAISKFIETETGEVGRIMTTISHVELNSVSENDIYIITDERFENTPAMRRFIRKFDLGYYKDLIIEGFNFENGCHCSDCLKNYESFGSLPNDF
jgi:hypothetical protein